MTFEQWTAENIDISVNDNIPGALDLLSMLADFERPGINLKSLPELIDAEKETPHSMATIFSVALTTVWRALKRSKAS